MLKGLIDLHTHGMGRYDTKTSNPYDILKMAKLFLKAGTTAFLPTIYSGTIKQMRANMEAVGQAMKFQISNFKFQIDKEKNSELQIPSYEPNSSLILGVHLEGPFLNPIRCGAQDKDSFIKPSISNLKKLIEGYGDIIRIITIAPELPGASRIIERCASTGIKVNMGHSDATFKQAINGKMAGATGITHIFNAMGLLHHREPGLAGFGLLDEDVYIEVIADLVHLDLNTIRLILKTKKPDRIIFVSDSVRGAIFRKGGKLMGSPMSLSESFKNLINSGISVKGMKRFVYENPLRYLQSC